MKYVASLLVILGLVAGGSWAGPAALTAAQVLARAKIAQGGSAWDAVSALRYSGELAAGGMQGRFDTLEDARMGAYVDRFDIGAIRGANGFDGASAWSQDASGLVRVEGGAEMRAAAASEAYRRSRSFWYGDRWPAEVKLAGERAENGRRFHVLTIMPRDGRAFDLWVNAANDLPDRVVQKDGPDVRTTFYSDYRNVSGLKIAYASRATTGNEKYDTVTKTAAVEINPAVEAAAYAPPPPPKPDSGFEGDTRTVVVPFEHLNGHVYLQVMLNGRGPFRLGFDSGGMNLIVPRVAKELGLAASGAVEGRGVGEASEDVAIAKVERVNIGPAYLKDQSFFVFPLQKLDVVEGRPIEGLIGYEVFRRFIVRFDYERHELTFSDPATWKYTGPAAAVPFVFNGHVPEIDGSIDGIPGKFDIDTGSSGTVDLLGPFVDAHGLADRYKAGQEIITGWGVGGPSRGRVARAGELRLGPVAVQGPVVEMSTSKHGLFATDFVAGNVGSGALRRFNVTFDYPSQRMYFEPNSHVAERDSYDRSGMWVNLAAGADGQFEVVEVVPGGPAESAGIRAGDRITRLDGEAASRIGLPAFRTKMHEAPPGTRIELGISAPGGDKTAVIVLRDLV